MASCLLVVGSEPTARRAVEALRAAGHDARAHVVIETVPVPDAGAIGAALARLPARGLLLFSSPAAVRHAAAALGSALRDRSAGVQGPGTAAEARAAGLEVAFEAPVHTAEGMFAAIERLAPPPGPGFLLFMAESGRGVLERGLRKGGYAFEPLILYRTREIAPEVREALPPEAPGVVIFTSPSAVRAFLACERLPDNAALVAMGSTTERELKRAGFVTVRAAGDYSVEGLVRMFES